MSATWNERIDNFWSEANRDQPEAALAAMRLLMSERPAGDSEALFEWASVHDFLGDEQVAVPLYQAALEHGLSGERTSQALIQLASSLRNTGDAQSAIALLESVPTDDVTAQAFLALALRDAGRPNEALRVALLALAPTLPQYGTAVARYAEELIE